MADNKKRPANAFYQNGLKLLANKFLKEVEDKDSEFHKLHEGYERTFEVWSKKFITTESMRQEVWHLISQKIAKKNG
jgi:nucleoside diphosphate kinase